MANLLPSSIDNLELYRPFSKIRLIAVDLDGTLLESNESELPEKILSFANKFKNSNIKIIIATGRTLSGAEHLIAKLPIKNGTPIILYNGSVIIKKKYKYGKDCQILKKYKPIHQEKISNESMIRVVQISSKFRVKVIAYCCKWFGEDDFEEHAIGWSSVDKPYKEYNFMPVKWLEWSEIDKSISPSAVVIHTLGNTQVMADISKSLKGIADISFTHGSTYIEVKPINCNKGEALKIVANILGLTREQILGIGDNDNDAEMLSWSGIGVSVETASEEAKKCSDYVARRGVLDGAIEALKTVIHARRYKEELNKL
ncbi:MAG: HAD-IIB family hydrolase [Desulfobacteraceae bacterium]|nr:HAD-IIB family hydrolase [Desulfobacteraceae bacterium]MBU3948956.1 HAD family hydrolase [Pseudomonadota bacterium]MBU4035992.1 HAD family hydrolase [Pseudomonadota bacterium]